MAGRVARRVCPTSAPLTRATSEPSASITGDEPHYLVIATSLRRDGDLDVLNNYREKHYLPFYPHHLGDPRDLHNMHAIYGRGGAVYSKHPLGLPLLVLPFFRNGDPFGIHVLMMALTGLLGVQVFLLARDLTGAFWPSLAAWAAALFSTPLFLYGRSNLSRSARRPAARPRGAGHT